jgi:hypothetical protein
MSNEKSNEMSNEKSNIKIMKGFIWIQSLKIIYF